MFYSTKTYGNDRGLSCCFRQWRASHSHCSTNHGYALGIKLIFEAQELDALSWAMDFGNMKAFKAWADYMFDHTHIVAADDPLLELFKELSAAGASDLRILPDVGCERFAELAYNTMDNILERFKAGETFRVDNVEYESRYPVNPHVRIKSVEVFEHAGNSAIYEG
jgi:6-pyruvoyltetrahydropterin/6-carboxytetrahydropterin synthase